MLEVRSGANIDDHKSVDNDENSTNNDCNNNVVIVVIATVVALVIAVLMMLFSTDADMFITSANNFFWK